MAVREVNKQWFLTIAEMTFQMNDNTIGGDKIHVSLARRRDDTNYTRERAPASAFDDLGPRNII